MHFIIIVFFSLSVQPSSSVPPINVYQQQHQDCLQISVSQIEFERIYEIHSYCLAQPSTTWTIQPNQIDHNFTFHQLKHQNITTEQLRHWSASLDLIEQYQLFLDDKDHLINSSTRFYNCSPPRFGPLCQYSFDHPQAHQLSLSQLIDSFFELSEEPTELTCYMHLQCDRGSSSSCLDWSEICDGYVDCVNDAVDERDCWMLEINECAADEYRCGNGQCIPKIFVHDRELEYECLDRSDETNQRCRYRIRTDSIPRFSRDEIIDTRYRRHTNDVLFGSCVTIRDSLFIKKFLTEPTSSIPVECGRIIHQLIHDAHSAKQYKDLLEQSCSPIILSPIHPLIFGHVVLAISRDSILRDGVNTSTEYVCYNPILCRPFDSKETILIDSNRTCHRTDVFQNNVFQQNEWYHVQNDLINLYNMVLECNTIRYLDSKICDSPQMYQCHNSSKCISISRLCDKVYDCPEKEDELCPYINGSCQSVKHVDLFLCPENLKCISMQLVNNGDCDCLHKNFECQDEPDRYLMTTQRISFPTICDGFVELLPIEINGRNETDETFCDHWQCSNTYTRCDGFWNCLNGADEIDCPSVPPSLLSRWQCPSGSHRCIQLGTTQPGCLSLEKANDGHVNCLGALDEPQLCRSQTHIPSPDTFFCSDDSLSPCVPYVLACSPGHGCSGDSHKSLCSSTPQEINSHASFSSVLSLNYLSNKRLLRALFDERPNDEAKPKKHHFSLVRVTSTTHVTKEPTTGYIHEHRCHRGLPILVWTDHSRNITQPTCLCPPHYYGSRCHYQNQRVSLTLRLQTFSDSRQLLLSLIVTLIDHSDQRLIHSYHHFTYLHTHHCQTKFNFYLLYATIPKANHTNYSIHIDIYEKMSSIYRGSVLLPIRFSILPVYRIAVYLQIPSMQHRLEQCDDLPCQHGQCFRYIRSDHSTVSSFCRCDAGWMGRWCHVSYQCGCSKSSQCVGQSADNRSICLCPLDRWGSSCRLHNHACHSDGGQAKCRNGGQCVPINHDFICICPKGYSGLRCEQIDSTLRLSFHSEIHLPSFVLVHFIQAIDQAPPEIGSTFRNIPFDQTAITVQWSRPFHIVIVEFIPHIYYLALLQKTFNASSTHIMTIDRSHRCPHLSEFFNASIVDAHLLIRIKYYHRPCQQQTSLSCFYDRDHFCVCITEDDRRYSNCFEFDPLMQHDCSATSACLQGARCLQDSATCPQTSVCQCPECYFGSRCQFTSHLFGLSLDSIIGYYIRPHVSITRQPAIIQMSAIVVMLMSVIGYANGILSLMTFTSEKTRQVGCGYYLLATTISTLFTVTMLLLKFWILVISQTHAIRNRSFLYGQCLMLDVLLRIGLAVDKWLNACVAIERAVATLQGVTFNRKRSRQVAKYVIPMLVLIIIGSYLHDPMHRELFDEAGDGEMGRIWCIVNYSKRWQLYNRSIEIAHFLTTFIINLISACLVTVITTRMRQNDESGKTFRRQLPKQFRHHRHLIITPTLLAILAVPCVVIQFISGCWKSGTNAWLFIFGYVCFFLPVWLCFVVFVVPSELYKTECQKTVKKLRKIISTDF